jgi:hypothetical protein
VEGREPRAAGGHDPGLLGERPLVEIPVGDVVAGIGEPESVPARLEDAGEELLLGPPAAPAVEEGAVRRDLAAPLHQERARARTRAHGEEAGVELAAAVEVVLARHPVRGLGRERPPLVRHHRPVARLERREERGERPVHLDVGVEVDDARGAAVERVGDRERLHRAAEVRRGVLERHPAERRGAELGGRDDLDSRQVDRLARLEVGDHRAQRHPGLGRTQRVGQHPRERQVRARDDGDRDGARERRPPLRRRRARGASPLVRQAGQPSLSASGSGASRSASTTQRMPSFESAAARNWCGSSGAT